MYTALSKIPDETFGIKTPKGKPCNAIETDKINKAMQALQDEVKKLRDNGKDVSLVCVSIMGVNEGEQIVYNAIDTSPARVFESIIAIDRVMANQLSKLYKEKQNEKS